ncbi:MAG: LysR family transcriptional regulator [Alphaproteobacteria bacterium]|nr:LysR family transcriptional regulator [Alphaproteobacteria bacterium]
MSNNLAGVDLNLLVALDLLLDERSVRAAARRAGVTPSAMSHTLSRLRDVFGDELLVRSGRRLLPTRRAEALADPVRQVLVLAGDLLDDSAPFEPAASTRAFRVVCTDHVSTVLLAGVEQRVRERAPGVDLHVRPLVPETMEDLRDGRADVAIGIFPDASPEVRMRRLFDDGFVTVARQRHPRIGPPSVSMEAFLRETHVLVAPRGDARGTVDEDLDALGLRRRVARTFPSFLAAAWHVADSDDLLTVSARLVAAVAPRLGLAALPPPMPLPRYAMHLAWHPRTDRSREDAWFRALLLEVSEALPAAPLTA